MVIPTRRFGGRMTMRNQAMVMTDVRRFELQNMPMPEIGPDDVGIAVRSVGICGSDMGFFTGKAFSIFPNSLPFILGHECAGVVYAVGSRVQNLQAGDRVAVEPGVPCGRCEFCESGRYNLCPEVRFLATPPVGGCLQRYIRHPAHKTYRLPDGVSFREGALVEPLSVGIHAVQRGRVHVGSTVAILGAGCIGMCTLLAAKAWGASRIFVSDVVSNRLDMALRLGATRVVNSRENNAVEAILAMTEGAGADVVFETAGIPATASQTSHIVKKGGTIVLVGNILQDVPFSFRNLYKKEAEVRAVFRYCNTYPTAIEAVANGRLDANAIVTNRYDFADAEQAFCRAVDDKENCVKCMISIGAEEEGV